MADDILDQADRTRQPQSNASTTDTEDSSFMRRFGTVFESSTFSLTFNATQWCVFWRLLNVGCMLSDQMQECARRRIQLTDIGSALLWDELSTAFAERLAEAGVLSVQRPAASTDWR